MPRWNAPCISPTSSSIKPRSAASAPTPEPASITDMERIWLKSYPPGVPAEIDISRYDSLLDIFHDSCARFARRPAYTSLGVTITYAQLDRWSRDFAAWLQYRGLKAGDRVALMLPNLPQYPVCLFASLRAGCRRVKRNPRYTAHKHAPPPAA